MKDNDNKPLDEQFADEQMLSSEEQTMTDTEKQTEEASENAELTLEEQLQQALERVQELEDKNLRMMAEFDNYRRRTNKEKLLLMDTAGENIFRDMLPLIDDIERAMQAIEKSDDLTSLKEGMELIYQKFLTFLERQKVSVIQTEGTDFDTDIHEAVTTFAAGEDKKGKIIDCTQKGYKLGDKVIRYAKVVVGE